MPDLLIISHTEHFQTKEGIIVGWEPTIREINSLILLFDKIYHIAPLYKTPPHKANFTYEKNIIFEPYNLDNTALIVLDGPNAAHGARKISKDVERKAIQLTYEPYSITDGWYGSARKDIPELLDL